MAVIPLDAMDEVEQDIERQMDARRKRFAKVTEGKSFRFKRRMERVERTYDVAADIPHARVLPKNEELRKALTHPLNGVGFRDKGSVEWPLDQFTLRRLRDGDVTLDESHPHQQVRQPVTPRRTGAVTRGSRMPTMPMPSAARDDEPKIP